MSKLLDEVRNKPGVHIPAHRDTFLVFPESGFKIPEPQFTMNQNASQRIVLSLIYSLFRYGFMIFNPSEQVHGMG